MERNKSTRNKCIRIIHAARKIYEQQLARPVIKQSKRVFPYTNYRTRAHHWVPNFATKGSVSQMIEEDQDNTEFMEDIFGTVLTTQPLPYEKLDPNTKLRDQLLTVYFDRDDELKALRPKQRKNQQDQTN